MASNLFREFVDTCFAGNQSDAATALDVSRALVCRLCSGSRSVTPAIAQRIESASAGAYPKEQFIWPKAVPSTPEITHAT